MRFFLYLILLPLTANAFTLTSPSSGGATTGWKKTKLQYVVNTSGCSPGDAATRTAIADAIAAWNSVSTARLTLENSGDTSMSATTAAAMTSVTGIAPIACFTSTPSGVDPAVVLGYSSSLYSTATLEIVQSFVVLNSVSGAAANVNTLDAGGLAATIAHEMGHSVGLGHSQDTTALMYFQSLRDKPVLGTDDVDGYTFLYPRGELAFGGFLGCGMLALQSSKDRNDPPPPGGGAAAVSLLAFFALCFVGARGIGRRGRQSEALTSAT